MRYFLIHLLAMSCDFSVIVFYHLVGENRGLIMEGMISNKAKIFEGGKKVGPI